MSKYIAFTTIGLFLTLLAHAQSEGAPPGYWPANYQGSSFTGELEGVASDAQEISLVYKKGRKSETFVGRLESTCSWKDSHGTIHIFHWSDIPLSTGVTAFYMPVTKKIGAQKTRENLIFAIAYTEINGKEVPYEKRMVIYCSDQEPLFFKVFR